jgi:hypothetical protein
VCRYYRHCVLKNLLITVGFGSKHFVIDSISCSAALFYFFWKKLLILRTGFLDFVPPLSFELLPFFMVPI